MRPIRGRRLALLLGLLLVSIPGFARAVTIVETARSTLVRAVFFDPILGEYSKTTTDVAPVGSGAWSSALSDGDEFIVSASQSSLIDPMQLSGSGSVVKGQTGSLADTRYHVVFAVDITTPYQLSVDNVDSGIFGGWPPGGSVHLDRVDPADFTVVLESIDSVSLGRNAISGEGLPDFADEGVLAPGTYALDFRLLFTGSHNFGNPASAGFALAIVPEPGTLVLVAAGLAVIGAQRRRRTLLARSASGEDL